MKPTAIYCTDSTKQHKAKQLSQQLSLPIIQSFSKEFPLLLILENQHLMLQLTKENAPGPVFVDFVKGALGHRRQFGGGKNQLIARAVGIKSKEKLSVLDATAGLGRDAFVLATLGCAVVMCEQSPIIAALLQDGLCRAEKETWFQSLSLQLIQTNSLDYLSRLKNHEKPDVIYLDPMFPDKTKSALAKKEMRVLKEVVGADQDSKKLLALSLQKAKYRVVVKRARLAPTINDQKPDIVYTGKSSRFDVYFSDSSQKF